MWKLITQTVFYYDEEITVLNILRMVVIYYIELKLFIYGRLNFMYNNSIGCP